MLRKTGRAVQYVVTQIIQLSGKLRTFTFSEKFSITATPLVEVKNVQKIWLLFGIFLRWIILRDNPLTLFYYYLCLIVYIS